MLFLTVSMALAADSSQHTVVPFDFINNKIVIQAEVGGQAYRFLLDTGGGMEVSPRVQTPLGLSLTAPPGVGWGDNCRRLSLFAYG